MSKIEMELQAATGIKGPKAKEERVDYLKRLIDKAQDLKDEAWEDLSTATQKWVNAGATAVNDEEDPADFPDAKKAAPTGPKPGKEDKKKPSRSRAKDEEDDADADAEEGDEAGDDEDGEGDADGEAADDEADGDDADQEDEVATKPKKGAAAKKGAAKKAAPAAKKKAADKPARTTKGKDKDDEKPARKKSAGRGNGSGAQVAVMKALIKDPTAKTGEIVAALAKKGMEVKPGTVSAIRSSTLATLRLAKELGLPKGDF